MNENSISNSLFVSFFFRLVLVAEDTVRTGPITRRGWLLSLDRFRLRACVHACILARALLLTCRRCNHANLCSSLRANCGRARITFFSHGISITTTMAAHWIRRTVSRNATSLEIPSRNSAAVGVIPCPPTSSQITQQG